MPVRALVTGGAGFIGSHVVDALLHEGHDVTVVDDLSTGRQSHLSPEVRFYQTSVTDFDGLAKVFASERPEFVSHHAAQKSVRDSMANPSFDALVNVVGSVNVFELSVRHGCERMVFASTAAVYSEPVHLPMSESHPVRAQSAYGTSKLAAEGYLQFYGDVYGTRYVVFRYANVYGPRQDPKGEAGVVAIFAKRILEGQRPTIYGDGTKTRDYVFVSDVVSANLAAMESVNHSDVMNLGRGIQVTDYEIFDLVRRAAGSDIQPVYADKRPGEADRVSLAAARAADLLKWRPAVAPEEGIQRTVDYFRDAIAP